MTALNVFIPSSSLGLWAPRCGAAIVHGRPHQSHHPITSPNLQPHLPFATFFSSGKVVEWPAAKERTRALDSKVRANVLGKVMTRSCMICNLSIALHDSSASLRSGNDA